jgi:hypothetical protein
MMARKVTKDNGMSNILIGISAQAELASTDPVKLEESRGHGIIASKLRDIKRREQEISKNVLNARKTDVANRVNDDNPDVFRRHGAEYVWSVIEQTIDANKDIASTAKLYSIVSSKLGKPVDQDVTEDPITGAIIGGLAGAALGGKGAWHADESTETLNELDLFDKQKTYFKMGNGQWIVANYRNVGSLNGPAFDQQFFRSLQWLAPAASQALGLDAKLANKGPMVTNVYDFTDANSLSHNNVNHDLIDAVQDWVTKNPPASTAPSQQVAQNQQQGVAEGMFTKAPAIDPIIGKEINNIINRLYIRAKRTKDEYLLGTVQELFDILRNTGGTYSAPGSPGVRDVTEGMSGQVVYSDTGANGGKYEIIQTSPTDFMIHVNGKHIDTYSSLQRAMSVLKNEVPGLQQGVAEGWKDVVAGGAMALGALGAGAAGAQTMPNINAQQVELANKYYNVLVQRAKEDRKELDTRTLNLLKAKAQDAAAKKTQQSTQQQGFPSLGSERRVAKDAGQFESQGVTEKKCPHCSGPMFSELMINEKKDACYYKVKSRYKVWPSAYASGALVKCRKKGADNWGNGGKKNESSILEGIEQADESLHDWFNKEKWVRMDTKGKIKGPCAREPGEGKPKCLPQSKAHSLGKKGRASAAARKRREDPNPERSGKAINVNTKKKD